MGEITKCTMTDDEFKLFRDLVHRESGIYLKETKKDFLRTKVEKRRLACGLGSFFSYYKFVLSNQEELKEFIDSVTINETYFFRNLPQFEMLREEVLPVISESKRRSKNLRLRLWSAGCATGEEPYSIAMEVLETIPDYMCWDIKIIASDISLKSLNIAQRALYPEEKLRDVPKDYLSKYFKKSGEFYEVREQARRLVLFDYHNLMHENPISSVDIVFCRNVLIYFEPQEQRLVIDRIRDALNTGGYLFLGHSESLYGIANGDFRFLYRNKGTAYQKLEEAKDEQYKA